MRTSFTALVLCLFGLSALAQVPGINVNMVSGTKFPDGDPFLQRQNEPSIAVSTRNPMKLLGGANDYRTVDIPFPPDAGQETGDAWVSIFKSFDGGLTWRSTLLPGFPQDTTSIGMASPLRAYATATDPTVRAGTHGLFYYSGLVLNRGDKGNSAVFVSTFQDRNNSSVNDTINYLNTTLIDTGNTGQFMDKPWLAIDVPRSSPVGSATCTVDGRSIISGNAYIFFTKFLGTRPSNNPHTQIFVARSQDCGRTWSKPTKVSESYTLNQGTVAAIDPRNGDIHLAWRQLASGSDPDSILYTVSRDGGQTFSKAEPAFVFPAGTAFDQSSSSFSYFRTFTLPALAVGPTGRVFLAFSQLGKGPSGTARVMMTTRESGSSVWSAPYVADPTASGPGHQMMPTLTAAYGKVMLGFYDFRDDNTYGVLRCPAGVACTSVAQYQEVRLPMPNSDLAAGNSGRVHTVPVADELVKKRHTVDVRAALVDASMSGQVAFPSVRVSQYLFGQRPGGIGPRQIEQLQFNAPNLPMFVKGKKGFIGDYLDSAALSFVVDAAGNWVHNTSTSSSAVFHFSWTDNRDVRTPPYVCDSNGANCRQNWEAYSPPGSTGGVSIYDPTQQKVACVPGVAGTRNQNVYAARVTEGLFAGVRENAKQMELSNGLTQRGYSILVQNALTRPATFVLSYVLPAVQAPNTLQASFSKDVQTNSIPVTIPARSSVARTLFVTSTLAQPAVQVLITQTGVAQPLRALVALNPDPSNPKAIDPVAGSLNSAIPDNSLPDATNPSVNSTEVYNPTVVNPVASVPDLSQPQITNASILSPDILSPDILSPDILSPDIASVQILSPDILSPDILSPDILSPDILSPDILSPDILSPDILSPDILSPDIATPSDNKVTDFTWKVTNQGNVSESYNIKMLQQSNKLCCPVRCTPGVDCPAGCYPCQLILRRAYPSPTNDGCSLISSVQNQTYVNISNPLFSDPANVGSYEPSGAANNPSISLAPGEGVRATLRVYGLQTSTVPRSLGQPVAIAAGDPNGFRRSLTITTLELPPAFVGVPYSTTLQSIGGDSNPARTWSVFGTSNLALAPDLLLEASSGLISGTPQASATGTREFNFQVKDSPAAPVQPHLDTQYLTLNVNNFSVSGVQVYRSGAPGVTAIQPGGSIDVSLTVSNQGPSSLTNVQVFVTSGGVSVPCTGPAPASLTGNGSVQVTVTCGPLSSTGSFTVGVRAQGTVVYGSQSFTVSTTTDSSTSIWVDNKAPEISATATSGGLPYTAGSWAAGDVTVVFSCSDADSGIPPNGTPAPVTISADTNGTLVPGTCTDRAGNTASTTFLVRIDRTKPGISVTATAGGAQYAEGAWTNKDVTVTFECTDTGSGIPAGSILKTVTISADTPVAGQTVTGSCTDSTGNTNSASFLVKLDKTAPTVTITTPASGATYAPSSSVTTSYSCTDALSGIASCAGPQANNTSLTITSTPGSASFAVTAKDQAGNTTTKTNTYTVAYLYRFAGFSTPLSIAGTVSAPSYSGPQNYGKAIPVKWELRNLSGQYVDDLTTLKKMVAVRNANCSGPAPAGSQEILLYMPTSGATGGSTFRGSGGSYIFNWDTTFQAVKACYNLIVEFKDTSAYSTVVKLQ